jgi:hypothetical protein
MKPWNSDAVRRGMDHDQVCGVALASIVPLKQKVIRKAG